MQKCCIELFSGKQLCEIHEYLNEASEFKNRRHEIENTPIEIDNRHNQSLNTPVEIENSHDHDHLQHHITTTKKDCLIETILFTYYSISFCSPVWNHSSTFHTFVANPS